MTKNEFHNALRILIALDRTALAVVLEDPAIARFEADPVRTFLLFDDTTSDEIWDHMVERGADAAMVEDAAYPLSGEDRRLIENSARDFAARFQQLFAKLVSQMTGTDSGDDDATEDANVVTNDARESRWGDSHVVSSIQNRLENDIAHFGNHDFQNMSTFEWVNHTTSDDELKYRHILFSKLCEMHPGVATLSHSASACLKTVAAEIERRAKPAGSIQ